jgi:hypothetical protein
MENESFAWKETLLYLQHLEQKAHPIPEIFQKIRMNIHIWGLTRWVELTLNSRHAH